MPRKKKAAKEVKAVVQALHAQERKSNGSKSRRNRNKTGSRMQNGQIVSAAAAYGSSMRFRPSRPQRFNTGVICEKVDLEMKSDSNGVLVRMRLNPGDEKTFPYLSVMAKQWEFYRFKKLRFLYETRVSTGEAGNVVLSPDYDNKDAANETLSELINTKDAVNGVVWMNLECRLDPKAMYNQGPRKKVSDSLMFDRDLYDSGIMYWYMKTTNTLDPPGILMVEYEVEFEVPAEPVVETVGSSFLNVVGYKTDLQVVLAATNTIITWPNLYGVQSGLSYSGGVFTATAKVRFKITVHVTVAGTTAASAFNCYIFPSTTGAALWTYSKTLLPADTGVHNEALGATWLIDLDPTETFDVRVYIAADSDIGVLYGMLLIEPY